jgi:hypothetical protein
MVRTIAPTRVSMGGGLLAAAALALTAAACNRPAPGDAEPPHVEHMTLPAHKVWTVVSVKPYEGLEEVELVAVDWPTAQAPTYAFALTREGLGAGDAVCLDHIREIDTFWAHPRPEAGCEALNTP